MRSEGACGATVDTDVDVIFMNAPERTARADFALGARSEKLNVTAFGQLDVVIFLGGL